MEETKKNSKKQDTKATQKKETKPVEKKEDKKEEKKVEVKEKVTEVKKEETEKKDTTKKVEPAKGKEKKTNKETILGIAVILVAVVVILAGVFFMADSPEKSVEKMLKDLKSGSNGESVLTNIVEDANFDKETQKLFFEKLDWKIGKVTEEGDKATVEVEITNKDFKTIMGNCIQKMIKSMVINEDQITNYLIEELKNDQIQTVTSNQSITVEKKDGKWKVSEENDFTNILLPGFNEAISLFN